MKPEIMYKAKFLSFLLSILNNDDVNVSNRGRNSLELHMSKRKAVETNNHSENTFAGYRLDDTKKLVKASKVNWPKSIWIHLLELCNRESITLLKYTDDRFVYEMTVEDDMSMKCESSRGFFTFFKTKKLTEIEDRLKEKESQGRVIREAGSVVNHKASASFLNNHKISDEARSFVVRGRMQLLQCESLMHTYFPETHTKHCKICFHPSDTVSHILNGCTKFEQMYQARHNRIQNLIALKIKNANPDCETIIDKIAKPSLFHSSQMSFSTRNVRPDILVIDNEKMEAKIIEIAVPFDAFLDLAFKKKFEKYVPLCTEINALGFYTEIIVLIIGSLGSVHLKFETGLRKLNISKTESKFLSKYCSISAIIGSHYVWKKRCKFYRF